MSADTAYSTVWKVLQLQQAQIHTITSNTTRYNLFHYYMFRSKSKINHAFFLQNFKNQGKTILLGIFLKYYNKIVIFWQYLMQAEDSLITMRLF